TTSETVCVGKAQTAACDTIGLAWCGTRVQGSSSRDISTCAALHRSPGSRSLPMVF
ncbi:hypothetical protein PISMIDRAFT_683429, partial [Pisolithus microcarpus 441]